MNAKSLVSRLLIPTLVAAALLSANMGWAQAKQEGQQASLAKQSQNPVANMISVPFENNYEWRAGPDRDTTVNRLNIKPVLPVKLSEHWNLINRGILPVNHHGSFSGQTIIPTEFGHVIKRGEVDSKTGIGDFTYQGFISPAKTGKFIWGVGPALVVPTGADEFTSDKWSIGPAAVGLTMPGRWVIGALIQNVWSFAGDSDAEDVNSFMFQYFVNYNMAKGWYLSSTPIITANWKADSGDKWMVPFGGGAGRIFKIGQQHVNAKLQAFYTPSGLRPDGASDWNLQFSFTFLFPENKK